MKILLAIPSKNRIEILRKNTYAWLPLVQAEYKVFVEPRDFSLYETAGFKNLVSIGENGKGYGFAKRFIKKYAEENGYEVVFKIDDDTKSFTDYRKKTDSAGTAKLLNEFLPKVMAYFEKYPNLGGVSFPYSFHLFEKREWEPVKKVQSNYIVRTQFLACEYNFSNFDDFAVGIDILRKGFKLMKYGLIGQNLGVAVGGGTGGQQDFDRKKQSLEEIELLRKIYPALKFKKVDKPWGIEPDMSSVKIY